MVNGTGIYRIEGAGGKPSIAFVTDRSISFQIYERLYRDRKYLPSFDELPWNGSEPKAEVGASGKAPDTEPKMATGGTSWP